MPKIAWKFWNFFFDFSEWLLIMICQHRRFSKHLMVMFFILRSLQTYQKTKYWHICSVMGTIKANFQGLHMPYSEKQSVTSTFEVKTFFQKNCQSLQYSSKTILWSPETSQDHFKYVVRQLEMILKKFKKVVKCDFEHEIQLSEWNCLTVKRYLRLVKMD